jgi:hypothetical protein
MQRSTPDSLQLVPFLELAALTFPKGARSKPPIDSKASQGPQVPNTIALCPKNSKENPQTKPVARAVSTLSIY